MATAIVTRTDEQIQKDVLAELKWDARVQPNEIWRPVTWSSLRQSGMPRRFFK